MLTVLVADRPGQLGLDPFGDLGRGLPLPIGPGLGQTPVADRFQHDHELVAADPGDRVARAQHGAEPGGRLDEYRVPGGVSGGVVDPFEVVEVAEQNRDLAPVSIGAIERGADPFDEQTPVRQSGQGVVQRHVGHLGFGQPEQYLVDVPSKFSRLRDVHFRPGRTAVGDRLPPCCRRTCGVTAQ